jgi:hypothetical protein
LTRTVFRPQEKEGIAPFVAYNVLYQRFGGVIVPAFEEVILELLTPNSTAAEHHWRNLDPVSQSQARRHYERCLKKQGRSTAIVDYCGLLAGTSFKNKLNLLSRSNLMTLSDSANVEQFVSDSETVRNHCAHAASPDDFARIMPRKG